MKVCFIAGTLGRGGAERQLLFMLRALQIEGIDTRVLCLTKNEAYERSITDLGLEVDWVGDSASRTLRLFKIIKDLKKRPADIIQSAHFYTNIYAGSAGRMVGTTSIGAIRSDLAFELETNNYYGNWQLRLPSHLISNSTLAKTRAVKHGILPAKVDFLKNVVEVDVAENTIAVNGSNETLTVLFAGRLTREKRPELFVRLAANLIRDLPHVRLRFVIAGDGPLRAELESTVAATGLPGDQLVFLGQIEDMNDIYSQSHILVLTSEHEGTPNVVLEAMSFGIPVVATNVGGVCEILANERGFLVGTDDFDGLCESVTKLINDHDLRRGLGQNGKRYVSANHSLDYLRERLTGIYNKLLRGGYANV